MVRVYDAVDRQAVSKMLPGLWCMDHDAGSDSYRAEYAFDPDGSGRECIRSADHGRFTEREMNAFHWTIENGLLLITYDADPGTPISIELRIVGDTCLFTRPEEDGDPMVLFRSDSPA